MSPTASSALFATLDQRLRAIEEAARAVRADLALLKRTADATATLPRPRATGQGQFELIVNRKRNYPTEAELATLNPADFDLFLDLVYLRLGFRRGGKDIVRSFRETGLRRSEIHVLRLLVERQGRPLTHKEVGNPTQGGVEPHTMRKIIFRLRRELGDTAKHSTLIETESKTPTRGGEGFGYLIPRTVRTCLIKVIQ